MERLITLTGPVPERKGMEVEVGLNEKRGSGSFRNEGCSLINRKSIGWADDTKDSVLKEIDDRQCSVST